VAGYIIFYGTQPGTYSNSIDVGNLLSYQLDLPGDQYYFVVCAYDAAATQGPFSNEVAESSAIALTNPGDQADGTGASVSLQLVATGSPTSYTAAALPPGLGIDPSTGVISGVISSAAAASSPYVVRATASNAAGNTSSVQFTWTIAGVNRAPTITPPGDQTTIVGSAASLAVVAWDPDGDALTFSASGLPTGLSIDAGSGTISGVAAGPAGAFSATVTTSDGSLTGSSTFTWTVTKGANEAPTLTPPGDQASAENATVSLQLVASDPDGDALTYGASGLPAPLTVDAATGLISGTLTYTSAGTYSVTAIVSDGSVSTSTTFTWTITNVDRAPALTTPADQTSVENATVSLQLAASDPDGDPLTYLADGLPPSLGINTATGEISGTLMPASEGTYTVTVTTSDGTLSQSTTFVWTVMRANQPPALMSPGNQTSRIVTPIVLPVTAADPDGDVLTFSAVGLPSALRIDAHTGVINGTVAALPGSYQVTVSVSDGRLTASQTFTWTVTLL
jgi:putative Ig domain-containing protein